MKEVGAVSVTSKVVSLHTIFISPSHPHHPCPSPPPPASLILDIYSRIIPAPITNHNHNHPPPPPSSSPAPNPRRRKSNKSTKRYRCTEADEDIDQAGGVGDILLYMLWIGLDWIVCIPFYDRSVLSFLFRNEHLTETGNFEMSPCCRSPIKTSILQLPVRIELAVDVHARKFKISKTFLWRKFRTR